MNRAPFPDGKEPGRASKVLGPSGFPRFNLRLDFIFAFFGGLFSSRKNPVDLNTAKILGFPLSRKARRLFDKIFGNLYNALTDASQSLRSVFERSEKTTPKTRAMSEIARTQ